MLRGVQWREPKVCYGDSSLEVLPPESPHQDCHQDIWQAFFEVQLILSTPEFEGMQLLLAVPEPHKETPSDNRSFQGVHPREAITMQFEA